MEYAGGGTLHKLIVDRQGELIPEDTIWEIFVQVCTDEWIQPIQQSRWHASIALKIASPLTPCAASGVFEVHSCFKCLAS